MGNIRTAVRTEHLKQYPLEEDFLKAFLPGFFITRGYRRQEAGSSYSIYFLNPEPAFQEAFGFNSEIALIYSPYDRMDNRTMQAAHFILNSHPARGRVEKLSYFLVSDDHDVENWIKKYQISQKESEIVIAIDSGRLIRHKESNTFIKSVLDDQFYRLDLFNHNSFLPLSEDTYFFGRSIPLRKFRDAIIRGENRGVFGLRKTGKTSFLFKVGRNAELEDIAFYVFINCKSKKIRDLRWYELLGHICEEITKLADIKVSKKIIAYSEPKVINTTEKVIKKVSDKFPHKRIILVFDEIEYISFITKYNPHWHTDYFEFFTIISAIIEDNTNINYFIAGVNPSVIEINRPNGMINPIFGTLTPYYLKGFSFDDLKLMISTLGERMGLRFSEDSFKFLFSQYGGHPSLTRRACSIFNLLLEEENTIRPFTVSVSGIKERIADINVELMPYCNEVVSELKEFYEVEYELLEMLCTGQIVDYMELVIHPEAVAHLKSYGLLTGKVRDKPQISIPVIERYISYITAKKENRINFYKLKNKDKRVDWVLRRTTSIVNDLRHLEMLIKNTSMPLIFGPTSFSEADIFVRSTVVDSKESFLIFINVCSRCFVESIEVYGKSISKSRYFWNDFQEAYPDLYYSLNRIKVYRNESDHLELNQKASDSLKSYLDEDLMTQSPGKINELYFYLQQKILDELLVSIQVEINKISDN